MGAAIKHPVSDRVKPSFCNVWHLGTLTLSPERQSAQMLKITNGDLIRSARRCFISCTHMATVSVRGFVLLGGWKSTKSWNQSSLPPHPESWHSFDCGRCKYSSPQYTPVKGAGTSKTTINNFRAKVVSDWSKANRKSYKMIDFAHTASVTLQNPRKWTTYRYDLKQNTPLPAERKQG